MIKEDKKKVVSRIKKHIIQEGNGYAGIVWAIKDTLGADYPIKKWQIDSIAHIIIESGKFKKEVAIAKPYYDYNISLNSESSWLKRNPWGAEIIRFVLTVGSSLLIYYLTK
ncbi:MULTISPECIES: hypothetical protein [Flavobacteriaceae]|uniref:hypothetical protein n=1 Tax=Flavobacteriaceae TaxID=49546 RepID=UPI003A9404F9